jgi:hypothetical protein
MKFLKYIIQLIFKKHRKKSDNKIIKENNNEIIVNELSYINVDNQSNDVDITDITINGYSLITENNMILPNQSKNFTLDKNGNFDVVVYLKFQTLGQTISIEDSNSQYVCYNIDNPATIYILTSANINSNGVVNIKILKGYC